MVFQISVLILIPIILTIVTYVPYDEPTDIQTDMEPIERRSGLEFVFLILMGFWFVILVRILIQLKKGTFSMRRNFR